MPLFRTAGLIVFLFIMLLSSQAPATTFKIASLSPEGSEWMQRMRQGTEEIARLTNDRVQFKFYPGGVMGDDEAVLRKIRIGQLQGGAFISGSLSQFFPDILVYGLPLIFRSFDEVDYVRQRMDERLLDGFEKGGMVAFGLAEAGFAYVMSKVPIRTPEDLRRQKVWAPDNDPTTLAAVKAFGVTPIPLSIADVRTSLQTRLIDTVAVSPIGAIALQWHTQVDYLTDIPLIYLYGMFALDRKAFGRLSAADQQVVRRVMGRVSAEIGKDNRLDNVEALEALRAQGIEFIEPSPQALAEWHTASARVQKELVADGRLSPEIVRTLENHLTRYRSLGRQADE